MKRKPTVGFFIIAALMLALHTIACLLYTEGQQEHRKNNWKPLTAIRSDYWDPSSLELWLISFR
eukprot:6339013-Amphidinium_carterae.1